MFHRITSIRPNANNYTIALTYDDGLTVSVDFTDILERGVMTALKPPEVFNSVQIGSRRRSIIWREFDIDFCADSLRNK
jgi:hypothetical protein